MKTAITDPWIPIFPSIQEDKEDRDKRPVRPERYVQRCLATLKHTLQLANQRKHAIEKLYAEQLGAQAEKPQVRSKDSLIRLREGLKETLEAAKVRQTQLEQLERLGTYIIVK